MLVLFQPIPCLGPVQLVSVVGAVHRSFYWSIGGPVCLGEGLLLGTFKGIPAPNLIGGRAEVFGLYA